MQKKKKSFESVMAVVLLAVMLVILTTQVVGRYFFNHSNSWSEELARYLFVWFVLIAASLACFENVHIKVDVALNLFPPKLRHFVECIGLVIFIVYALVITYFSGIYTVNMAKIGQISLGLKLPMVFVYISIPICHALMAVRSSVWLVRKINKKSVLNEGDSGEERRE